LDAANGDHAVAARLHRLCHQELQLPDLVAGKLAAREIIPLDPHLHALRDAGQWPWVDGRRENGHSEALLWHGWQVLERLRRSILFQLMKSSACILHRGVCKYTAFFQMLLHGSMTRINISAFAPF